MLRTVLTDPMWTSWEWKKQWGRPCCFSTEASSNLHSASRIPPLAYEWSFQEKFTDNSIELVWDHKLIFICHPDQVPALLLCCEKFSVAQVLTFTIIELPAWVRLERSDGKSVSEPISIQVGDYSLAINLATSARFMAPLSITESSPHPGHSWYKSSNKIVFAMRPLTEA